MILRDLVADDWPAVHAILRSVAEQGETYDWPADISEPQLRAMWVENPGWRTVVATTDDGAVLGVADFGPNRIGRGAHVANASFVVAPGAGGQGVGRALGEHVVRAARADGFAALQFNAVVETNTAAVALWTSLGFAIIGTVPEAFEHPRHGRVGLHVMHRPL
ncbi:acetyltransferase, GNAT family [Aeromicrobium marinum DSM 15272]|uniref:Acetyltransferase, GNAT family n=1 Tax=Aeromicrobium marinum DSM 15272 TaxID=585531 RepID=E2S9C6_9ACTN|nr:GNAT family N-acetyltransferase [Aeromicrobium marinum]EFQ83850.1 acetyltransferase, GNAT family [Aeromicrobium marinum DSM 15272]